ncbi:hypothetical protein [Shewanella algae]|uniref:hypothetical protein n=1 Tax=Shewanella algae TaxID=38313 RepID=UPI001AAEADBA|nr:hypothetical protein [Shewanella algae]MBO2582477.1 hypothetical protein [Shewanella algae]
MNDSKSKVEIHPKRGLKMELVTDKWIRKCIGFAVVIVALSVLLLASAPLMFNLAEIITALKM